MSLKFNMLAAAAAAAFAMPAFAGSQISVADPYAISSGVGAIAGAAFMTVHNSGDTPDRLVGVESDVAKLTQLHTHIMTDDGVAKMVEVPEGWPVPAGGDLKLARGGNHVMFMGLKAPFTDGEVIHLTLDFEKAGKVAVDVPVDLARATEAMPMGGASGGDSQ